MAGQALDPSKLILPGNGTVLQAPAGTEPFDLDAFDLNDPLTFEGWELFGHTSRENLPAFSKEGGEVSQKGTWEQSGVRAVNGEAETYTLAINALEVTQDTLELAFGGGVYDATRRRYAVKEIQAQERALFLVMLDGTRRAGIDMKNTSIKVGDLPSIDVENFFEVQLLAQVLTDPVSGEKFGFWEPRPYVAPAV
jgi:hypothetical protein